MGLTRLSIINSLKNIEIVLINKLIYYDIKFNLVQNNYFYYYIYNIILYKFVKISSILLNIY